MTTECSISVLDKICVEPPYFNLFNLKIDNQMAISTLVPEQPIGNEHCVIAAAEVGRHLAILGSCAIAAQQPDNKKRFYLAKKASFEKTNNETQGLLTAKAICTHLEKRTASAYTNLFVGENSAYTLKIDYQILEEGVFQKLFSHLKTDTQHRDDSPYKHNKEIVLHELNKQSLTASIQPLLATDCAGHFKNFPSMPIAILCQTKIQAAEQLLAFILGEGTLFNYHVMAAEILAHTLIPTNETITLKISLEDQSNDIFTFICMSYFKNVHAGSVKLVFRLCN